MFPHGRDLKRSRDPEGPWERSASVSEVDANQVGVHGGSTAGQASGEVNGENTVGHDDTQQGGLRLSNPATHAGAHRTLKAGHW